MSMMIGGTMQKYAYQRGPYKKYSTEYTWTLYDWSLIHESSTRIGAESTDFVLNGTPGYTCCLELCPTDLDWILKIYLPDTEDIQAMKVTRTLNGHSLPKSSYSRPIPESLTQGTEGMLDKSSDDYIFEDVETDTLRIVVTITIVMKSDFDLPHPAEVSPMMYSSSNSFPPKFKTMLEKNILCDITFVVGDQSFNAHKVVLALQSEVFEAMFSSGMKEQTDDIIELTNTTPEIFEQFLNYLYSGKLTKLETIVEKMIVLADFYNVSELKIMCENVMLESLSEDTVIGYVILADKLNCDSLKNEALCLIRSKADVLEKALLEEDVATVTCLKDILFRNQLKVQPREETKSNEIKSNA